MTKITYVEFDGTEHIVEAQDGDTLMTAAVNNSVPGIDGDCGGNCACATCHIYIDGELGLAANEDEKSMLGIADNAKQNSRLGCQIAVTGDLDGLVVQLPYAQH